MMDDIYLAFYRPDDYESAQEAMDSNALYIAGSDLTGAYTALEDCFSVLDAAEHCTGVAARTVIVNGRKPTKYVEVDGAFQLKLFREDEFWDRHKKFVKYFKQREDVA